MNVSTPNTWLNLSQVAEQLRLLTQLNVQSQWRYCLEESLAELGEDFNLWPLVELNERKHIAWLGGQQILWIGQTIIVPETLCNYPLTRLSLKLVLSWWAEEAQIYVNDNLVQSGDLFDCYTRVLLSSSVQPVDEFNIKLRLVSPGHDRGALVQSYCWYEHQNPEVDPGFIADELEILEIFLEGSKLEPDLEESLAQIAWESLPENVLGFERSLSNLRNSIQAIIPNLEQYKISLLGHAHLDLAWLWPVAETWEAAQRTFESVLNLQQDFPNLIFCHSSPALYDWIEKNRPDLFIEIQNKVKQGVWEITAGLWVEPELNIINGESLVRQVLYGQRYCLEKFGELSKTAWLPDTFGFCWQLPQIFKQGGIDYFITQKLRWNDTTKFPYGLFWWEGLDQTKILSFMTALIGERIDPVKMAKYAVEWKQQTGFNQSFWLPGVGDHGGGPTRDMLEMEKRWQQSDIFPQCQFQKVTDYLNDILKTNNSELPVWSDELYLEFHRGCYTTHADQKRFNRHCETLLYQAELFASLATISTNRPYPKAELETAWKITLFNQFHDILPGSSIHQVYEDANQDWKNVIEICNKIIEESLDAIATTLTSNSIIPDSPVENSPKNTIVIFNSLNWSRSEVVRVPLPDLETAWQITDTTGEQQSIQYSRDASGKPQLLFVAKNVPAVGYRVFNLGRVEAGTLDKSWKSIYMGASIPHYDISLTQNSEIVNSHQLESEKIEFENEFLRVKIDPETGNLIELFDIKNQKQILEPNREHELQFFQDQGQYWDGWNIDPNYQQYPLPAPELKSIDWIEQGSIEWRLRVVKIFNQSEFQQDYILQADCPILKIETTVNWQERHILVKAAFPLTISSEIASYEIPCGVIERPTNPQTDQEKAKWEVPAIHWADISQSDYGVSILNDCKYGYDAKPNQLRLTVLRSSTWPDEQADLGIHQFSYGIYPHVGNWKQGKTVHRGYELNCPLQTRIYSPLQLSSEQAGINSFLDLQSENLILMALKQSEDHPESWIIRCYECEGKEAILNLESSLGLTIENSVNLLEETEETNNTKTDKILPFKIANFLIKTVI